MKKIKKEIKTRLEQNRLSIIFPKGKKLDNLIIENPKKIGNDYVAEIGWSQNNLKEVGFTRNGELTDGIPKYKDIWGHGEVEVINKLPGRIR
jgi:hypothetical protein